MVIVEQQSNGTYRLRGRTPNERATVPFWPCQGFTIKKGAVPNAPKDWLAEAAAVARNASEDRDSEP